MLALRRGENRSTRRKTSRSRVENQQTQPTYDAESGNRTRATLVEGECSDTAPTLFRNIKQNYICENCFRSQHLFYVHTEYWIYCIAEPAFETGLHWLKPFILPKKQNTCTLLTLTFVSLGFHKVNMTLENPKQL